MNRSRWRVGDVVTIGRTRWAIRTVKSTAIVLEGLNTDRIVWRTSLDLLPRKGAA